MTVTDHPELELLKKYLYNTESDEFGDIRLHLAQCSQCRSLLEGLMGLEQIAVQVEEDSLDEHEHQWVADYIDNRLSHEEQQKQKQWIDSDASAMKAALHYASHKASMDRANLASITTEKTVIRIPGWSGLLDKIRALFHFEAPVWFTVPVTAALVAVLSIGLIQEPDTTQEAYRLASYQDNPVIQFHSREKVPGIGFFAQPTEISQAYDNLNVSVSKNREFHIQWSPVAKAREYTLRLQMFDQGRKRMVSEITTAETSVVITPELDTINHRYEWILSGDTRDGRTFLTKGGFVIESVE